MKLINYPKTLLTLLALTALSACSDDDPAVSSANQPPAASVAAQHGSADAEADYYAADDAQYAREVAAERARQRQNAGEFADPEDENVPQDDYTSDAYDAEHTNALTLREGSVGYVEWTPPAELAYEQASVTLIGPDGKRHEHNFGASEAIALNQNLPDGAYRWESVVTPSIDPYALEQMQAARESGDIATEREVVEDLRASGYYPSEEELKKNRQSGGFVVRNGVVLPADSGASRDDTDG